MTELKNIEVHEASVLACPPDRSPIFFVNIEAEIKSSRITTKYKAEKIVVKGTFNEIKSSDQTKRQLLKSLFEGKTNRNSHIKEFDLSRITITKIEILSGLGYGIKSN